MGKPVSAVKIGGLVRQDIPLGKMEMREDEEVDRVVLQHLASVADLGLILIPEDHLLRLMGNPAFVGDEPGNAESNTRMQHAIDKLVGFEGEDRLDKAVAQLFAPDAISMADQTSFAVDDELTGVMEDLTTELFREEILQPHVMVSGKVINLNSFAAEVIKRVKKFEIPLGHHILIFEPEIEDISQQEEMLDLVRQLMEELYQQFLAKTAFIVCRHGEVHVGDEAGVALDDDGVFRALHRL